MGRAAWESSLMVEHHLVKVGDGGSSPLFPAIASTFRPLGGMVDTADSKSAFCWFKPSRGYT